MEIKDGLPKVATKYDKTRHHYDSFANYNLQAGEE